MVNTEHEKEIDTIMKNLERLAKSSRTEIEIKLDGAPVALARLEPAHEGGIKAVIGIKDFKKALTSPALIKTALSFLALRGTQGGKKRIDFEFESGMIKRLFGKSSGP